MRKKAVSNNKICLAFNGSSASVGITNNAAYAFGTGSYSLAFWIKFFITTAAFQSVGFVNQSGGTGQGFQTYITPNFSSVTFGIGDGTTGTSCNTPSFSPGSWHLVTMVVDRSIQKITGYTDGGAGTQISCSTINSMTPLRDLYFGSNSGGTGSFGKILLQDASIYNIALTQAQIKLLYADAVTPLTLAGANCVGWWRFNDGSGTTPVDSSATANNGAFHNNGSVNPQWQSTGGRSQARSLAAF